MTRIEKLERIDSLKKDVIPNIEKDIELLSKSKSGRFTKILEDMKVDADKFKKELSKLESQIE